MIHRAHHARRGFAMLLVLCTLAVATVLATAYLASRDNSAMIGQNVSAGSSAKWAALATLKSGIATLETTTDWRNNHTNGVVFANASLSGADVDLQFMDRVTGAAPNNDTTEVEITATARMNGITESVVAYASVPPLDKEPDLDLSEFVVFAKDKLQVKDTSVITRWNGSPKSELGLGLSLGTLSASAGAIEITDYAVALDSTAFAVPSASSMVVSNSGPGTVQVVNLSDTVIVPEAPSAGTVIALGLSPDLGRNGPATASFISNKQYNRVTMRTGASLTLRDLTFTAEDDISIETGSKLIIRGNVKIIALKNFRVTGDSSIVLENGATLTVFVKDEFQFDDSDVRALGDNSSRTTNGNAHWIDPTRLVVYEYSADSTTWKVDNDAVLKGSIYAPNKKLELDHDSALYGQVVAKEVVVHHNSAIYYDHILDKKNGYTNKDSAIYDSDGKVKTEVKSLTSLSKSLVDGVVTLISVDDESSKVINAGDPTPRTVKVSYEIVSFASNVPSWESKATLIASEPRMPRSDADRDDEEEVAVAR